MVVFVVGNGRESLCSGSGVAPSNPIKQIAPVAPRRLEIATVQPANMIFKGTRRLKRQMSCR